LLARRLAQLKTDSTLRDLQSLARGNPAGIDPELISRLRDPAFQEVLQRLRDGDPELLRHIEEMARTNPALRDQKALRDLARRLASSERVRDLMRPEQNPPRTEPSQPAPDAQEMAARRAYAERIGDLLHDFKLDGVANSLHGSDAFRDILKDVARSGLLAPNGANGLGNVSDHLATLESMLTKVRQWLPTSLPQFPHVQIHAPGQLAEFANNTLSGQNLLSIPSMSESWSSLMTALAIAGVVFLAWVIVFRGRRKSAMLAVGIPVTPPDPDRVARREDLICAFEQLSLFLFGTPAEHWHHRRIADRLADKAGARADAETLAELYEQARYAPANATADVRWEAGREPLRRLIEGRA
jgi:hypothetical protein